MNTQTPLSISKEVSRAAQEVTNTSKPVFINIDPSDDAELEECFRNIKNHVNSYGGEIVYGWNIFVWPRVWVEFEAHSMLRKIDGSLRDITPRRDGEGIVLFLQDDSAEYKGLRRDNLRFSLSQSPLVKELMSAASEKAKIQFENQHPYIQEFVVNPKKLINAIETMNRIAVQLNWKPERNDPCPCGSRRKYKSCHAK